MGRYCNLTDNLGMRAGWWESSKQERVCIGSSVEIDSESLGAFGCVMVPVPSAVPDNDGVHEEAS